MQVMNILLLCTFFTSTFAASSSIGSETEVGETPFMGTVVREKLCLPWCDSSPSRWTVKCSEFIDCLGCTDCDHLPSSRPRASPAASPVGSNIFEENAGTGYWGGYCTCPDGQRYAVGDKWDACGSLACDGGKVEECNQYSGEWSNNRVTCGVANVVNNNFEENAGTGDWGGYCTCPNGQRYAVGDKYDACGSLACVGGKADLEECNQYGGEWSNNRVTCGGSVVVNNIFEENAGTGYWGGYCTCPNGQRYSVGDNNDWCGSLACIGGKSGECNENNGEWSTNKVTCGSVEDTSMLLVEEDTSMLLEEESLVAEAHETAFVRWLIYGLAIFGCFTVVQKSVSLFQKEQEYTNVDQEC